MKSVNHVTQYFVDLMTKNELGKLDNGGPTLLNIFETIRKQAAEQGAPPETAAEIADKACVMAVMGRVAFSLEDLVKMTARTGKLICELADPEMVKEHKPLMTEAEKEKALEAAVKDTAMLLSALVELLQAVNHDVDDEHIAERVLDAGRKHREQQAEKAEPEVKAKPVSGTAVPFGKRIEPSQN